MFSVNQPWDPLNVCVVGKSYPPEFYSWIKNSKLRSLFERIALETEEDYQNIISTLKKFNVEIIRPNVPEIQIDEYLTSNSRIPGPISMNPRDQMIMIGNRFFFYPFEKISIKTSGRNIKSTNWTKRLYDQLKGPSWPQEFTPYQKLPKWVKSECKNLLDFNYINGEDLDEISNKGSLFPWWDPVINAVKTAGNTIVSNIDNGNLNRISPNGITRIGKKLFFGTSKPLSNDHERRIADMFFRDYECQFIYTGGHIDGTFSPVAPGLIMSIKDMDSYANTFPDWEVCYLQGESWAKVKDFLELKKKNQGRWWIKDYEKDTDLINFVETWLNDWVGYVEETVFDVNILTINEKNVIVNGYNKKAFDTFDRHGITPHICPMRHRYFWDGGIHCVTLDLDRSGSIKPFPRGR
jgi:hypothetical protein